MMPNTREQMTAACRWLCQRGYAAGDDASISWRDRTGQILITPRGGSLRNLEPDQVVLLDDNGRPRQADDHPALATPLHLTVYGRRGDAAAVLVTQPPSVTAFAVAAIPLVQPVIPETVLTIGSIPLAPYTTPYTPECVDTIQRLLDDHDALLLQGRGLLVLGASLNAAIEKVERIENMAAAILGAKSLGHVSLLTGEHIRDLMSLRKELRLGGRNPWAPEDEEEHHA
jgi:L-fuculose-phosphate aldolase